MIAHGLDDHGHAILERELERRVGALPVTSRTNVERVAQRVVRAVTEAMIEHAAHEPALATALWSIYGGGRVTIPAAAAPAPD